VKLSTIALVLGLIPLDSSFGQYEFFGQNKVQYSDFDWKIINTPHFEIFFYEGGQELAEQVADLSEESFHQIIKDLQPSFKGRTARSNFRRTAGPRGQDEFNQDEQFTRIPLIIYKSYNDFGQTNVTWQLLPEGTGAFTEFFKSRVVLPYTGSYYDLRHLIYHELTHALVYRIRFGGAFKSVATSWGNFLLPQWFEEGLAEYESHGLEPGEKRGFDIDMDMWMRDATMNNYLPTDINQLQAGNWFHSYQAGQDLCTYIADTYGPDKLGELIVKASFTRSMDRAFQSALGKNTEELSREWITELKKKYWPQIAEHDEYDKSSDRLLDHKKDRSGYNLAPAISPSGDKIAYFSDKNSFGQNMQILLMSAIDGEHLGTLVKGALEGDFESIHFIRSIQSNSAMSWSPDGTKLAFTGKKSGQEGIFIIEVPSGDILGTITPGLDGVYAPNFSPDGEKLLFVGLKDGYSDIYLVDVDGGNLERITNDTFDERDPSWSPDGRYIAYSSDLPVQMKREGKKSRFQYTHYDIFLRDIADGTVKRVIHSPGNNSTPVWSPDGDKIAYVSDRTGISNLYIHDLQTSRSTMMTDIIGGVSTPSWSQDGRRLAFNYFYNYGWDIYVMKNPLEKLKQKQEVLPILAAATDSAVIIEPSTMSQFLMEDVDQESAAETPDQEGILKPKKSEYKVSEYKLRFTPDLVDGGFGYDGYWGFAGSSQILFSDILGNHQFYFGGDIFGSKISDINFVTQYSFLPRRTDFSLVAYNFKNNYYGRRSGYGELFSANEFYTQREYGGALMASRPFDQFRRLDFSLNLMILEQTFYAPYGMLFVPDRQNKLSSFYPGLSLIKDTVIWGYTGPMAGSRYKFSIDKTIPSFGNMTFTTLQGDYRKYWSFLQRYSFAVRMIGQSATGKNPLPHFYTIGPYSIRGYNYFEFSGTKLGLFNAEFRFPFIDYLAMAWPLPMLLGQVRGVIFFDAAGVAAGNINEFRGLRGGALEDLRLGYGFGIRIPFIFLLRIDVAWNRDHHGTSKTPRVHFSIGPDF
jgi:Tol biopolymer transport system component